MTKTQNVVRSWKWIFWVLGGMSLGIVVGYEELHRQVPNTEITRELEGVMGTPGELKLLFTGDTGTGNSDQKDVALAMEKTCVDKKIDGVVLLGDNFYDDGVKSVDDPQWLSKFADMYNTPCLASHKFYVVLGNHDMRMNPNAQILYTQKSNYKWNLPNRFYALHFKGIADFFALDSNFPDACGVSGLCSLDWIGEKMKESEAPWKIVMGHHPVLSGGKYPRPKWLAALTLPRLLCQGHADFYFSAHDHNLQHLRGQVNGEGCEVNQLVVGGGGGSLNNVESIPGKTLFAAKSHGYVFARLDSNSISVAYYAPGHSSPIYQFSQNKIQSTAVPR